ncbi:hypothetical protein PSYAR_31357, partial [Pseudomonas syringae pv. aceris str. M302273]
VRYYPFINQIIQALARVKNGINQQLLNDSFTFHASPLILSTQPAYTQELLCHLQVRQR